ncbi:hypothetical protein [Bacillus sp. Bva_UNVM-123]|uniref:hypothetical protein n=1 Tax=Bacillus sp. Bva_UNVM-123 TaxID=2829798 RepID=UPI00391F4028
MKISTNWIPVYMEKAALIFLDDQLTVDFCSSGFLIKSTNQIYGYSMRIENEQDHFV